MLTVFGACVVTFMMLTYALEGRGRRFVLAFAVGCALSSTYGFLAGTWPFGIVEGIWSVVAVKRYLDSRAAACEVPSRSAESSARSASPRTGSSIAIESRRSEASVPVELLGQSAVVQRAACGRHRQLPAC
jgi:hypothetical protein